MLPLLLASLAHATGLPPMEALAVVGADCQPVEETGGPIRVTFDLESGVCAPRQDGPSCSTWIEAHLDAGALVVRRDDCAVPMPGRFVPDGRCGDRPRWRWKGRLDAGHPHLIGRDFQPPIGRVGVRGASERACPADAPVEDPVKTAVVETGPEPPLWVTFPAEGYAVEEHAEGARLTWRPGPMQRAWLLGDAEAALRSAPMDPAAARAVRAGAKVEPTGLAARHQVLASREWHEGHTQRGVVRCWRVLEMDLQQQLRLGEEGKELGPPMVATVRLREGVEGGRCGGE